MADNNNAPNEGPNHKPLDKATEYKYQKAIPRYPIRKAVPDNKKAMPYTKRVSAIPKYKRAVTAKNKTRKAV